MGQTHFGKLYVDLCFLKSIVLWPYYILLYIKMHHIWYCIWGNAWIVDMENMSISDLNPMIRNLWTLWYIGNLKVLIYLVLYYLESIDTKHFWQEILLRILWIFDCCNTLWNYLEVNYVFWIHWTCELLMWLCPCAMMLVITPSWWQQAKLETHRLTLCMTQVNPWVCGWGHCL